MAFNLLQATEAHMGRKRLPIVRGENHLYPTEGSVVTDDVDMDGKPVVIGACARAVWYRHNLPAEREAYSPYTYWIFNAGKALEVSVIEMWKQMGLWLDSNVKFYNKEYNISGEFDAILMDPETGKPFILECKTFAGYNATKEIVGNKWQVGKPKDAHLLQVLVYLSLHQDVFPYAKLVYIDKATSKNAEFTITLTKEGKSTYPVINGIVSRRFTVEQIFERYKEVAEMIKDKDSPPPRDFEMFWSSDRITAEFEAGNIAKTKYEKWKKKNIAIGSWVCSYCPWNQICYDLKELPTDEENDEIG